MFKMPNYLMLLLALHLGLGHFGNYRYGPTRKKAILGWELARTETELTTIF